MLDSDSFEIEEYLEEEIEDIYLYHGSEFDELPPIEFKDHIEEDLSNYRFTLFFCLIFAIIGAVSLAFIAPILAMTSGGLPGVAESSSILRDQSLWNPIIGGLLGAMIGSLIGWILDSLIYGVSSDRTQKA